MHYRQSAKLSFSYSDEIWTNCGLLSGPVGSGRVCMGTRVFLRVCMHACVCVCISQNEVSESLLRPSLKVVNHLPFLIPKR